MKAITHNGRRRVGLTPYLLVAPAFVLILLVFAYPIVRILVESFLSPKHRGHRANQEPAAEEREAA